MINQIAAFLNVTQDQVKSVTEFAFVYNVVVFGRRARFVSKKVVKMEPTKYELAVQIQQIWATEGWRAKVWTGGDVVRVYLGKDFVQVTATYLNFKKLNHNAAYNLVRHLSDIKCSVGSSAVPVRKEWQKKGYVDQLDYDMEDPNGLYYG